MPARSSHAPVTPCAGKPLDAEQWQPGLKQSHTHCDKDMAATERSLGASCRPPGDIRPSKPLTN